MEYYSAIKKEKNCHLQQQDGPRDCHTEWSKLDTERWVSYDTAYM